MAISWGAQTIGLIVGGRVDEGYLVSYIYSTFCSDTAFVARSIHQMTRMINYQNQDWYSFPLFHPVSVPIWTMKNRDWYRKIGTDTGKSGLIQLRDKTRFISIGYLISFCCVGVARSALVAADVITSRCLTSRCLT
jgi:hypothetical protein